MRDRRDLHNYQEESVKHIVNNPDCALFLEMGLGKTVSTLTAVDQLLYEDLDIDSVLVVAPKRVAESVWAEEATQWSYLHRLKFSLIIGNEKKRKKALQAKADIYVISRDNIAWLCGLYGGSMLPFDMLVIDELSSFKNPKSIRFKALRHVRASFKRIVGLTGTPAPNGLIDLWSQIYLLDGGERLGKFLGKYRQDYFKPDKQNGSIIYTYKLSEKNNEQRIYDKIGDICISMKAKDYLTLPGRMTNIIKLSMPGQIKAAYEDFEKQMVLELFDQADTEITAVNAAALSNKLLQYANGAVYDDVHNYHVVHELKIEATKEIIESAQGKPVLIAWTYRHDMERLKKALSKYVIRELKTDKDIQDWNAGKIEVLMMHPASGGHGLNLQAGGHIVLWFGQTWSLELEQQFNARLDRQGQKEVVIIHKLVVEGTMDEDVIAAQNRKEKTQDGLMEAVKARIKKYTK